MLILLPILLPILAGGTLLLWRPERARVRETFVLGTTLLNTALAVAVMLMSHRLGQEAVSFTLLKLGRGMSLTFAIDSASMVFGFIVAVLWPITTVYAFEYMTHEGGENRFFGFFTISYGVVLGVAFAENFVTLYLFYELLTLATLPLVMHGMNHEARYAGRKYLIYSFSGATLVFIVLVFFLRYGATMSFTLGGVLDPVLTAGHEQTLRRIFLLGFFGFGVKAAVFPLHGWLPDASVAPTPVSALLHAVAVVKSGVFAIMRLIYFGFGTEFLYGSVEQTVAMAAAAVTIVFGSAMAMRTPHLKRRLAYSTVSNLSYILFAFTLMTPEGMAAGMTHMIYHAVIKITLFFCAGAILYKTGREYVYELQGFGRAMPVVLGAFSLSALGLMGVPPFGGFIGKWCIATAATATELPMAYVGAAALAVSALLTALYLMSVILRAYFPVQPFSYDALASVRDPNGRMTVPLLVLSVGGVVLALSSQWLTRLLAAVAAGL